MATKSAQGEPQSPEAIEEMLDTLDVTLDRVKVLYEQYFLGIQKQPPTYIHRDVERKLRDLTQLQIRNTGLRYRFATLQQKFGSYNSYWRRTVRQIENGTYARNLSKIGRQSVQSGQEIPEEILAAMPKRMRAQVQRDRDAALAIQRVREKDKPGATEEALLTLSEDAEPPAFISEPPELRRKVLSAAGAHIIKEDAEFDLDAFFQQVAGEPPTSVGVRAAAVAPGRTSSPSIPPPLPVKPAGTGAIPGVPRPQPPAVEGTTSARSGPPAVAATTSGPRPPAPAHPGTRPPAAPSHPGTPPPAAPAHRGTPPPAAPARPGTQPSAAASAHAPARPVASPITAVPGRPSPVAPSQVTRPIPIAPGSSAARPPVPVESMAGPFPRPAAPSVGKPAGAQSPRLPTPPPEPAMRPPPGMTDADVNALYAKYVKAKELVGENAGPGSYGKLLKTINAQAPKIMEQYKATGVDFSVVVKDNQVIIKAKPKA